MLTNRCVPTLFAMIKWYYNGNLFEMDILKMNLEDERALWVITENWAI